MALFRKKPVVIEAQRWDGDNVRELRAWAHAGRPELANSIILHDGAMLQIRTLEGWLVASVGDMIIKGVKGEFYPCKPDIFSLTYEPAIATNAVDPQVQSEGTPTPRDTSSVNDRAAGTSEA